MANIIIELSKTNIPKDSRITPYDIFEYELKNKFRNVSKVPDKQRMHIIKEFVAAYAPEITQKGNMLTIRRGIAERHFRRKYEDYKRLTEKLRAVRFDDFAAQHKVENLASNLESLIEPKIGVFIVDCLMTNGETITLDHWLRRLNFTENEEMPRCGDGLNYYVGGVLRYEPRGGNV